MNMYCTWLFTKYAKFNFFLVFERCTAYIIVIRFDFIQYHIMGKQ